MNIFYLDRTPKLAAEYHCDKHVVKMILESAQLLSTAHRVLNGLPVLTRTKSNRNVIRWALLDSRDTFLYQSTHINHPSAIWARQSRDNYAWLFQLLDSLCEEYTFRYGKIHKVQSSGLLDKLWFVPSGIAEHPLFTDPPQAMPDDVKCSDTVEAYRNFYKVHKASFCTWKRRFVPAWFV